MRSAYLWNSYSYQKLGQPCQMMMPRMPPLTGHVQMQQVEGRRIPNKMPQSSRKWVSFSPKPFFWVMLANSFDRFGILTSIFPASSIEHVCRVLAGTWQRRCVGEQAASSTKSEASKSHQIQWPPDSSMDPP